MNRKVFIALVMGGVLFFFCHISQAHTGLHVINATLQNVPLKPHYYWAEDDVLIHKDGSATIVRTTEGDCASPNWHTCTDERDNGECKSYYHYDCEHETLYYPLPQEQVVFDGKKRLKFVENGHYMTIARHDRRGLTREWNFYVTNGTMKGPYPHIVLLFYIEE